MEEPLSGRKQANDPVLPATLGGGLEEALELAVNREALELALKETPMKHDLHGHLAWTLMRLGEYQQAIDHAARELDLNTDCSKRAWLHIGIAICFGKLEDIG